MRIDATSTTRRVGARRRISHLRSLLLLSADFLTDTGTHTRYQLIQPVGIILLVTHVHAIAGGGSSGGCIIATLIQGPHWLLSLSKALLLRYLTTSSLISI